MMEKKCEDHPFAHITLGSGFRRMGRLVAVLLTALIAISAAGPIKAMAAETGDQGPEVTRGQWIHELVETFDMQVEEENWPEEYFSDIEPDSPYYHDYLLALEFGVIDTPLGRELRPDDAATREFAAHTLNFCLGFETQEDGYSFDDYELTAYPGDDQVAVSRGWFELRDGSFLPDLPVTLDERNAAFEDAIEVLNSTTVDEDHVNRITVYDGVKVIPEGTEIIQGEENVYQIASCPIQLVAGDTFVAYFYGMPQAFIASDVYEADGVTTVYTEEADPIDVFKSVDCEGSFKPDVSDVDVLEPTKREAPRRGAKGDDDVYEPFEVKADAAKGEITIKGQVKGKNEDYDLDGTVNFEIKLSNMEVDWKDTRDNKYAILRGNVDIGVEARGGFKKELSLLPVPIRIGAGVIEAKLDLGFAGDAYVASQNKFECGAQWTRDGGYRFVPSFTKRSFTARVKAEMDAEVKIFGGFQLAFFKAGLYCKIGPKVEGTYQHYTDGKPATCVSFAMYLKGSVGVEAKVAGIAKYDIPLKVFWDKYNSPIHINSHYEDGVLVYRCTRDGGGYLTNPDGNVAQVYGGGLLGNLDEAVNAPSLGVSSGTFSMGTWEFKVTSRTTATILKYRGSATSITIPSTLYNYTITAVDGDVLTGTPTIGIIYPSTVTTIGSASLNQVKSLSIYSDNVTLTGRLTLNGCAAFAKGTINASELRLFDGTSLDVESIASNDLILDGCSVAVRDRISTPIIHISNDSSATAKSITSNDVILSGGSTLTVEENVSSSKFSTQGSAASRIEIGSSLIVGELVLLGANSNVSVGGAATIGQVARMGKNAKVTVRGLLRIGTTGAVDSNVTGGIIEAYGDVLFIGKSGYEPSDDHVLRICGAGAQSVKGGGSTWINNKPYECYPRKLALANPHAIVTLPKVYLILEGDGQVGSVSCRTLTMEGQSLRASGVVSASDEICIKKESSLYAASLLSKKIVVDGASTVDVSDVLGGLFIDISDIFQDTIKADCDSIHIASNSVVKCGSVAAKTIQLSLASQMIVEGNSQKSIEAHNLKLIVDCSIISGGVATINYMKMTNDSTADFKDTATIYSVNTGSVNHLTFEKSASINTLRMSNNDLLQCYGKLMLNEYSNDSSDRTYNDGVIELFSNFEFRGSMPAASHLVTVLRGEGSQCVEGEGKLLHVVVANRKASDVHINGYSGAYVWDPYYKTGDKYMEFTSFNDKEKVELSSPPVTPTVQYGHERLVQDIDYRMKSISNYKGGETCEVVLEGITSSCKGTNRLSFNVQRANIVRTTAACARDVVYNGDMLEPELIVTLGDIVLEQGNDYTVIFYNNYDVGNATARLKGIGEFTGTKTFDFSIKPTKNGQRVTDMIALLDVHTLADEPAVIQARLEYDKLGRVDKESVANLSLLVQAELMIKNLYDAVANARDAIDDAENLLTGVATSLDGSDIAENQRWLTSDQVGELNTKISNARAFAEAGGTLLDLLDVTSGLISALNAVDVQLGTMHVPGDEIKENETELICTEGGTYDLVTYCSICGKEISRSTKTVGALGHDYKEAVVEPTWDEGGYTRHTCTRCGDAYDDEPTNSLKVQGALVVEEAIAALPATDDLTLADSDAVSAARAAYDALTDEQKGLVSNVGTLELAEARLAELAAYKEVDDLIAALPAPDELTLMYQAQVEAARTAYEALSDSQKSLVTKLALLEDAERVIGDLVDQLQLVGTCVWELNEFGELSISPIPGRNTGTLPDSWTDSRVGWLWVDLMGEGSLSEVKSVRFGSGVFAGSSLAGFLGDADRQCFSNLKSADLSNLNTSATTDVRGLFAGCTLLESVVGVESLVSANVTGACGVFTGCSVLQAIDISSWDTSGITCATALADLFDGCDALAEVRLGRGVEASQLGLSLPVGIWTNGSLYIDVSDLSTLSVGQMATIWRKHVPVDIAEVCEFAPISAQQYTGLPVTPPPVVTHQGVVINESQSSYTVSYQDNVGVGEATVTVTGKGYFCGQKRIVFNILAPQDFAVESMLEVLRDAVASAEDQKKAVDKELADARDAASGDDIASIQERIEFAEAAVRDYTQDLQSAQESYDTMVALLSEYEKGTEEYDEFYRFTQEAKEWLEMARSSLGYAESELLDSQRELEEATARANAVSAAEAETSVAALLLSEAQDALAAATDLSNAEVADIPAHAYSGAAATPEPVVEVDGVALRLGTDYELVYASNVDAGRASVTVTGRGSFGGAKIVEFDISPKDLSEVAIGTITDVTYAGRAMEPEPVLTDGSKILVLGTDYDVSYGSNTDAGDAVAHVTGKGNYAGAVDVHFHIRKAAIAPEVTLASWSWAATPNDPVVTGNAEGVAVTYEYKARGAGDEGYSGNMPTEPGQYTLRATVAEGANHLGAACTCDFEITWLGVTFDANGGEGAMAPQSFESAATQKLAANAFARKGMRFDGWNTSADGEGASYADGEVVTLRESLTLYAQWADARHTVTFMANDKLQGRVTAETVTAADYPADPAPLYGFEFMGWDKTIAQVNADLAKGDVTVTAVFRARQAAITVTIFNGESEEPETLTLTESQWVKVTARDVPGKNFAYWTMGGTVLSYNRRAQFRTATSCTVTAVYTSATVAAEGTAMLRTVTYDPTLRELYSVAYLTVPDGATITKAGLVAASASSTKFDAGRELSLENADYKKYSEKAVGKSVPVTYTWTKTGVAPGDVWYVRPYVSYVLGGEPKTVYGERVDVTAGNDYDQSERATAIIRSSGYDPALQEAQFVAYIALPEGGTIVRAGVVAAPSTSFDPVTDVLTWDNATYQKVSEKAVGKAGPLNYTWTKSDVAPGDTWYVRAYVTYALGGQERTLYGTMTSLTAAE